MAMGMATRLFHFQERDRGEEYLGELHRLVKLRLTTKNSNFRVAGSKVTLKSR